MAKTSNRLRRLRQGKRKSTHLGRQVRVLQVAGTNHAVTLLAILAQHGDLTVHRDTVNNVAGGLDRLGYSVTPTEGGFVIKLIIKPVEQLTVPFQWVPDSQEVPNGSETL